MSNEMTLKSVEESLLPVVSDVKLELELVGDQYSIVNHEQFMDELRELEEQIDNYEYQSEDRQAVKKFRAAVNKYSTNLNKAVKEHQAYLFGHVNEQKAEASGLMSGIIKKLDVGLKADEARIKAEKTRELIEAFENAIVHFEYLKNSKLQFEDVQNSSWSNITTSKTSAIRELDERLIAVNELTANIVNPEKDVLKNVDALRRANWNELQALNLIVTERQALEAEKTHQAEIKEQVVEKIVENVVEDVKPTDLNEKATILIHKDDLRRVEAALKGLKVDYTVIL
mgnify:FL=1|jgi:hypothetical protein